MTDAPQTPPTPDAKKGADQEPKEREPKSHSPKRRRSGTARRKLLADEEGPDERLADETPYERLADTIGDRGDAKRPPLFPDVPAVRPEGVPAVWPIVTPHVHLVNLTCLTGYATALQTSEDQLGRPVTFWLIGTAPDAALAHVQYGAEMPRVPLRNPQPGIAYERWLLRLLRIPYTVAGAECKAASSGHGGAAAPAILPEAAASLLPVYALFGVHYEKVTVSNQTFFVAEAARRVVMRSPFFTRD
jgi:hypothetical protein